MRGGGIQSNSGVGWILCAAVLLAACSGERANDAVAVDPLQSTAARTEDKFGKGFGKAFRADPNSEPVNVSDSDVTPVSLTSEPVHIN
jgi:hypothetical protein